MTVGTFPFGAPVRDLAMGTPLREVSTIVVGAYPSAVHVEWTPPQGMGRRVAALPVDNEPYPFWDGSGMDHFVERWRGEWFRPEWGTVRPSRLNGSSGRVLHARWLARLRVEPDDYFVTDCLPTSMKSTGVATAVEKVSAPLAGRHRLPPVVMQEHPSENAIVTAAVDHHERLRRQVEASGASIVVTLGNAAARVVAALSGQPDGALDDATYEKPRSAIIGARTLTWHALVHPAVRAPWVERHDQWVVGQRQGATA
ncbi:hypothetical protein [Arthrobacter sp. NEB 688]|uniref:hypothetical protein n=1 Tax=Arthrobacter sp. NEB 688 TaxID=904039 RepID=UPI0015678D7C|nr:hypothetical protein [Arthrobacter sp. NEB 688]QKE84409.1 hypothetical protein HL663_10990 [Arthrobacter sp. NEB 688]